MGLRVILYGMDELEVNNRNSNGTSAKIDDQRVKAAELSGGTSADAIYKMIESVIRVNQLSGRILDYGAGKGHLSRRLADSKIWDSVYAVDLILPPEELRAPGIHWLKTDLNNPLTGHDESFDVVVAAEVIEHLENPRQMVRDIHRLLRPGGTVILTTPNNESWRSLIALLVRGHFVAFDDSCYPAHITALVRKDLSRILAESGFSATSFAFTNSGGLPGMPTTTWQDISFGNLRNLRYSDNLLALARKH